MSIHQPLKGHRLKVDVTVRTQIIFWVVFCIRIPWMFQATPGRCKADFAWDSKAWEGVLELCVKYVWLNLCKFNIHLFKVETAAFTGYSHTICCTTDLEFPCGHRGGLSNGITLEQVITRGLCGTEMIFSTYFKYCSKLYYYKYKSHAVPQWG